MKQEQRVTCRTAKDGNIVTIRNFHLDFKVRLKKLSLFTHATLKNLKLKQTALSLVFVSDAVIKRLNQAHLNHNWVTDVIAFPFSSAVGGKFALRGHSFMGEVVISPKRAEVCARRLHIPFHEELARYVCHGILHLVGYSDHSHRAKIKMRQAEDKLLKPLASKIKGIV